VGIVLAQELPPPADTKGPVNNTNIISGNLTSPQSGNNLPDSTLAPLFE
jgi:hypothetical protein